MEKRMEVLVVPHSHWDRAWYWPFERFRAKLCSLFEVLFEALEAEPDFEFTLDGQGLLVKDYLEIYPEARARIEREAMLDSTIQQSQAPPWAEFILCALGVGLIQWFAPRSWKFVGKRAGQLEQNNRG
jgi:alpha-mannosidase